MTPEEAATLAGVTCRTISSWIESGDVHFREMPGGSLLIGTGLLCRQDRRAIKLLRKGG